MERTVIVCIMALLLPLTVVGQVSKESRREAQRIQASADYYWGLGGGGTQDEASRKALVDLMSKIYVSMRSDVSVVVGNEQSGQDVSSNIKTNINIETSTGGVLTNTEAIILEDGPQWGVLRYVPKSEVDRLLAAREDRVLEYMQNALKAEETGRIDNALRYYYWAYCLLRSLPNAAEVTITEHYQKRRLLHFLPEQIENIFDNLKVEAAQTDGGSLNLVATYKDKPVTSLDFSYSYGKDPSPLVSFKDGIAQVKLHEGFSGNSLQVNYEYRQVERSSQGGEELQQMVRRCAALDAFSHAQTTVDLGTKKQQKAVQQVFQANVAEVSQATHAVEVKSHADHSRTVKTLLSAILARRYQDAASLFTPEGYDMFQKLITFGQAIVMGQPEVHFYEGADGRVVCRSIPMNFAFKNNHITFNEEVTLTLNPEGKIESLAFALDNDTRRAIFESPAQWSPDVRMAIATFLENYKTAFALKKLDYIRGIFDDYAIIVTGTVTMKAKGRDDSGMHLKEDVKYTTFNKNQYMERLEQQFKKNQYINLRFTDVTVKQAGRRADDDTFGLRIKQDYFSSTYADTGYLFLLVDMNQADQPLIKLRTWQPHRDPAINSNLGPDNSFYGLIYEGNFQ